MRTKIEWAESSWNPITGCTKVSPGCLNCYAEKMAHRLKAMGQEKYRKGFDVVCHPECLDLPLKWKKPRKIFVNSMSDLFHKDVPTQFVLQVFDVMRKASHHIFQVLTKRSERLQVLNSLIDWPPNVWMGVSIENKDYLYRIDELKKTNARIKFVSFEPLLGFIPGLKKNLSGLDWVIVGGESGPGARPMKKEWILPIRDECIRQEISFFFKQWGGVNKKKRGRLLGGITWGQFPKIQKVLEKSENFPDAQEAWDYVRNCKKLRITKI